MKTQSSFRKSGFTLIELMVVIAIIGILFYIFSGTGYKSQEYLTKAERLANKISSVLHDGLLQITIGKMAEDPSHPTLPIAITGAVFTLGTSSCLSGSGITWYYAPTSSGKVLPPFFDSDPQYAIDKIEATGGTAGTGDCLEIDMTRDATTFSGVDPTNTIVVITTRYNNMKKKVTFDRRTGRIEVNKN